MRANNRYSLTRSPGRVAALLLLLSGALAVPAARYAAAMPSQAPAALESTVFTYDGKDFVRSRTTLAMESGQSAVNTKLERDSPAFKALMQKHSYVADGTVFGKRYSGNYAPLVGDDGKLTGALFVGVAR